MIDLRLARVATVLSTALAGFLAGCAQSASLHPSQLTTASVQPRTVSTKSTKPVVYIASPYSKGDPAINTHFQCQIFDQLMNDGLVWPVAPLWSHFQHTAFPRAYQDWVAYDLAMIPRYDVCLRVDSVYPKLHYSESASLGADREVAEFQRLGKPVFYSIKDLYEWVKAHER